ncbi:MAG: protein kinase [Acidobacteriota bacterium]|nr:protein kinase [Acidobacteriota bacterium]
MPIASGTMLGPYEVCDLLGAGGMGSVYRARDRRLDRDVALKVISDDIAQDPGMRSRFEREAKAIAALSHPNILSIFDFSKDHDVLYAVTELLRGETLRRRMDRGKVPWREAVDIALAISSGLAAAHDRGVVHRDLKPENIFLTSDGHVKILDFGLATLRKPASDDEKTEILATKAGQVVGTVPYMAPEQIRGGKINAQTDLFSLGSTLYEALSGRRPFRGENSLATIAAILDDRPPALPDDVPSRVASAIMRCLEKDPAARFASASEFREALSGAAPSAAAVRPPDTRVIVLPFRMLRRDEEVDFLAYSLPDAIVSSLAGINSMIVRSSLAAQRYASEPLDIARIATEQDVNAILSGSILSLGGRLRVSAQLAEAPSGTVKWSHSAETTLDDIFGLQDELTRKIVRTLSGSVTESDSSALRKDVPRSALGYEFFLRANQQAHEPGGWLLARDLYRRSVEEDPNFAPAWARLGRTLWIMSKYTDDPEDNLALAQQALQRAIELNPDLSLAQRYYAELEVEHEQTIDSLRRLKESVQRRPNNPDLRAALGKALRYSGLLQESLEEFQKVRELDQNMGTSIAHTYFMMGDYPNAQRSIHRDIFYLGPLVMAMLGAEKEAIKQLRETMERNPDRQFRAYHQGLLGALEGDHGAARRAGNIIVEHNRDPEALFYVTRSFARIGDVDRALELLERLSRSFFSPDTFEHDPWLEPLRSSPRFAQILRAAKDRHAEAKGVWSQGTAVQR